MIAVAAMSSTARCSPPPAPVAGRLRRPAAALRHAGHAAGVHPVPDDVFTMADGARLPARVWLPPDGQAPAAVILALHGFNDSRDQWALPAPVFADAGIAVYAPDQRGFGDTAARADLARRGRPGGRRRRDGPRPAPPLPGDAAVS